MFFCSLMTAINCLYLAALDNNTFGFANVSMATMLTHLHTTYGPFTHAELETNQARIVTLWSPTKPIESLSEQLHEVQHIAAIGGNPIVDVALIDLTIILLKSTGVFTMACNFWHVHLVANKTICKFVAYFTAKNKEHLHKLMTGQVGFLSANAATISVPKLPQLTTPTIPPAPSGAITTNDGLNMYYCWTHGLGFNCTHTSAMCLNPADGHYPNAMVKNMQGSNNLIMLHCHHPKTE